MAQTALLKASGAVALIAALWVASTELAESYAFSFEKLSIAGVPNAGRINAHLYRGAQPTATGLAALRAMGVDTVVSFTLDGDGARTEAATARSLGLRYVHMPWSATGLPADAYISDFLDLFRPPKSAVVFVHCKAGADRTGLMIAAYRILSDGWTFEHAMDEMDAFGYEVEFHPQLRDYVHNLANHAQ
jgi:tyrosine-protein phosphatase SIW14